MTAPSVSLKSLRHEIDLIDDQMHDLLMRRTEFVERIGETKSRAANADAPRLYIRPAREVAILRRLVKRHEGRFPTPVVVRIWREMVAATSRLQAPLSVAVQAPEKSVGYWDLARDQYGSCTPMTLHRVANLVIRAVIDGTATVGVLSLPQDGDPDPWWRMLLSADKRMPRIVARLPFIDNKVGRFEDLRALAIAQMDQEKTGDDVSLVAAEADPEFSRASLTEAFTAAGLPANSIAVWDDGQSPAVRLHLVEISDFVERDDPRLAAVLSATGGQISRITPLGGYATPLGLVDDGAGD